MGGMATEKQDEATLTADLDIKKFALDFSAHGCKNVASPSRGKMARVAWLISVLVVTGFLISYVYGVYSDFYTYPFRTETKIAPQQKLPFPSVTLCNINPIDISVSQNPDAMRNIMSSYSSIGEQLGIVLNESEYQYASILNMSTFSVLNQSSPANFTRICMFAGDVLLCDDVLQKTLTYDGLCMTFNGTGFPADKVGPRGGLRFIIDVNQAGYYAGDLNCVGIKLVLHEPEVYPDTWRNGIILSAGQTSYVAIHRVEYSFLGVPYLAFGKKSCYNGNDRQLKTSQKYSYAACIHECVTRHVSTACNCSVKPSTDFEECSFKMYLSCISPKGSAFYDETFWREDLCGCPRPCSFVQYGFQISNAVFPSAVAASYLKQGNIIPNAIKARSDFLEVNIFYDDMILKQVTHVPIYNDMSLLGTVGGQMGLFLGASLLTLMELGEFLLLSTFKVISHLKKCFSKANKRKTANQET